jgi:hypothetical protein
MKWGDAGRGKQRKLVWEGDVHHAVWCAAAQADGDGGCKYERVSGGSGERCRTEFCEGLFDDERMLPGR